MPEGNSSEWWSEFEAKMERDRQPDEPTVYVSPDPPQKPNRSRWWIWAGAFVVALFGINLIGDIVSDREPTITTVTVAAAQATTTTEAPPRTLSGDRPPRVTTTQRRAVSNSQNVSCTYELNVNEHLHLIGSNSNSGGPWKVLRHLDCVTASGQVIHNAMSREFKIDGFDSWTNSWCGDHVTGLDNGKCSSFFRFSLGPVTDEFTLADFLEVGQLCSDNFPSFEACLEYIMNS